MKKLLKLQAELLKLIEEYADVPDHRDQPVVWERVHMASSARLAYLLAEERRVDPLLASCACSIHDIGRIITGQQKGHAEMGYHPAKRFLQKLDMFTEDEIEEMARAVKNHSNKGEVGTPLEEIVKDADVLDFHYYGYEMARQDQQERLDKLLMRGRKAAQKNDC